jgi:hypothetical protein
MAERARRISRPNARSVRRSRDSSGTGIAESRVEPTIVVLGAVMSLHIRLLAGDRPREMCPVKAVINC